LNPNTPFGGYKQSGLGREWGAAGLSEYLQHKSIVWSAGKM
jgi:aldehyde dehydrogenase (NAD+)